MVSYAPELPGALEFTGRLAALGIVPAAGHSSAKEDEVAAAIDLGLKHIIHIWSAQSTTVREGPGAGNGSPRACVPAMDSMTRSIP